MSNEKTTWKIGFEIKPVTIYRIVRTFSSEETLGGGETTLEGGSQHYGEYDSEERAVQIRDLLMSAEFKVGR